MYKLGIDVGGSKIRGVVLDKKNKNIADFDIVTPKNKIKFLSALEKEISRLKNEFNLLSIGVGLPGIIDMKRESLIKSPNLSFLDDWQAKKFFLKFCKNVKIENDGSCFLLAESRLGSGRGYKNVVGIVIGTGIGGAIMIDGKLYHGANSSAGELGHMILQFQSSRLKVQSFEQLGAKKAFEKYGDRSEVIGIGVANIINILNPEIVILGGGGVATRGVRMEKVRSIARKYAMSPLAKKTPIVGSEIGKYAGAVGAALLN